MGLFNSLFNREPKENPLGAVRAQQHLGRMGYAADGQTRLSHPPAGTPGYGDWANSTGRTDAFRASTDSFRSGRSTMSEWKMQGDHINSDQFNPEVMT